MDRLARYAARRQFLELRAAGFTWQVAAATAELPIHRTAAFLFERRVRQDGDSALIDQRHGHPSKFRAPARAWLEATCRAHPEYPGHQLQHEFSAHFGVPISLSQINRVRRSLGLRYQPPKKRSSQEASGG